MKKSISKNNQVIIIFFIFLFLPIVIYSQQQNPQFELLNDYGSIIVTSEVSLSVYIDNQFSGNIPENKCGIIYNIPYGIHTVTLLRENKNAFINNSEIKKEIIINKAEPEYLTIYTTDFDVINNDYDNDYSEVSPVYQYFQIDNMYFKNDFELFEVKMKIYIGFEPKMYEIAKQYYENYKKEIVKIIIIFLKDKSKKYYSPDNEKNIKLDFVNIINELLPTPICKEVLFEQLDIK